MATGFYDVVNFSQNPIPMSGGVLAVQAARTLWLTDNERDALTSAGVRVRHNLDIPEAPGLDGIVRIRDLDTYDQNSGGVLSSVKLDTDSYELTLDSPEIIHMPFGGVLPIPRHADVAFPFYKVFTVITGNQNEGGGQLFVPRKGYDEDEDQLAEIYLVGTGDSGEWIVPGMSITTLMKVEEDIWYISGAGIVMD